VKGVLDTTSYHDLEARSWIFRSIGWGTDTATWKRIVTALRLSGFDGVVSIEHEDALASRTRACGSPSADSRSASSPSRRRRPGGSEAIGGAAE